MTITLEDLGYHPDLTTYRKAHNLESFGIGRVISEHKERYIVRTTDCELESEVIGSLRFSASDLLDFPAVGDWVSITEYDDDKALIHIVLPRKSIIERKAVGKYGEKQIIATNVDYAFVVQAADRDFNINRIERYLTICHASGVEPILLLTKTDLASDAFLQEIKVKISERKISTPLFISNETREGYDLLSSYIQKGKTYCLLGSSGVGKSSLMNNLLETGHMKTGSISDSTSKGRHITSHRELVVLESGGMIIDNPGMREVGITDVDEGLEITYQLIIDYSKRCKYRDCTHTQEDGCAVQGALISGEIDPASYENYLKMEREKDYFESTQLEKRKRDKEFGKMIKHYKKSSKRDV